MVRFFSAQVLSILIASVAFAAECKLNIFIYSEYIDPEIVTAFEKKNNCKLTLDVFEDSESMLSKMEGGGSSLYDVVISPDYIVPALVQRKLIQPLRRERIPNVKNIDEKFISAAYDKDNAYTVPYQWGTVGIYIRKKPGQVIDESWSLYYDPTKQPGSFVMIDSMRENFSSALRYLGHSVNTTDVAVLKKVKDLIAGAKKRATGLDGGVGGKNKVLAKGVAMAVVYNGDAVRGMDEDPDTYFFVPKEGSEIWVDTMVVAAKAPNRDMAENFINYILEPEVGAKLSDFNQYATPNKAARALVNPDDLKNPAIYPTPEIMAKLEFLQDLGDSSRTYDELWTQVKAE